MAKAMGWQEEKIVAYKFVEKSYLFSWGAVYLKPKKNAETCPGLGSSYLPKK